jgi:hypothetical protein
LQIEASFSKKEVSFLQIEASFSKKELWGTIRVSKNGTHYKSMRSNQAPKKHGMKSPLLGMSWQIIFQKGFLVTGLAMASCSRLPNRYRYR